MDLYLEKFLSQYLVTALWSSTDDGSPLDDAHDLTDITPADVEAARADCKRFIELADDALDGADPERAGHDFWLTRNGHGAGFWDGDWSEAVGKRLTEISHKFPTVDPYVGDDGLIHF